MRTLLDIPEDQIKELAEICERRKLSRSAAIREAIASYVAKNRLNKQEDAFGLWGDRKIDGLAYQEKLRSEW